MLEQILGPWDGLPFLVWTELSQFAMDVTNACWRYENAKHLLLRLPPGLPSRRDKGEAAFSTP